MQTDSFFNNTLHDAITLSYWRSFSISLVQRFPNFSARGPLLASASNRSSSYPCPCKYTVSGWQVCEIKNL
jgi:hypothetical protein